LVQKQKIFPLFVSKGQRVNRVYKKKKNHWHLKNTQSPIKVNCSQNKNKQEQIKRVIKTLNPHHHQVWGDDISITPECRFDSA